VSSAIRAKLGFPGCYSLLSAIVAAFAADMVRTTHRLTAWARLNDDRGCGLVRVAGALLPLRGSALRDGHGIGLRRKVEPLVGLAADFPQRIPAAVSGRCTVACAGIQIGTTGGTESLTVVATLYERRNGEQPLLAQRRTEIQLTLACIDDVHIGIFSAFRLRLDIQKLHVFGYSGGYVGQTSAALTGYLSLETAAEVVSLPACGGQPTDDVHRRGRSRVFLPPDRVVRRQPAVDLHGSGGDGTNVKGQHSQPIYRVGGVLSSQRDNKT
jgi:hypothetical protein